MAIRLGQRILALNDVVARHDLAPGIETSVIAAWGRQIIASDYAAQHAQLLH